MVQISDARILVTYEQYLIRPDHGDLDGQLYSQMLISPIFHESCKEDKVLNSSYPI